MEQNIHYDILSFIAEEILTELYVAAMNDARIMVCDWRAYAILKAYRLYARILGVYATPSIDDCFSGDAVPDSIRRTDVWKSLADMHTEQWNCYNVDGGEETYSDYLNKSKLVLPHFVLSL